MKTIWLITKEIISDIIYNVLLFIEKNLRNFATLIYMLLPYAMMFIGQYVYDYRNKYSVGGEVFVPLVAMVIIYMLNQYANRLGRGITVPVPRTRFTTIDEDGEVTIEVERLNELLLYTADLEDWFERKGMR